MSLTSFLSTLFEDGCVQVPEWAPLTDDDRKAALHRITEYEATYRAALPGVPPEMDASRALAAAEAMFRACQCLVYRELDPQELLAASFVPEPGTRRPADHYSADLAYRFLPDVWRLSRNAAANDPLVSCVRELAARWPLSSVGIADLPALDVEGFINDRCLLTLYVDRIVERRDRSRLTDSRVRSALREACGMYTEWIPELAAVLAEDPPSVESPA